MRNKPEQYKWREERAVSGRPFLHCYMYAGDLMLVARPDNYSVINSHSGERYGDGPAKNLKDSKSKALAVAREHIRKVGDALAKAAEEV